MDYGSITAAAGKYGAEILYDKSIADYTSFGIGGKCDVIVFPGSAECVAELVSVCRKEGIRYYVLGKCTNVLISDNGLRGVVIMIGGAFSSVRREGNCLVCDAGAPMTRVCSEARNEGLGGLEFAYGIPGSAGGCLYMNAGAFGGEMKDVVKYCDFLNEDGTVCRMYTDEMGLSYRHSVFSGSDRIILSVCFELAPGDREEISAKMTEIMTKRREKQPLEYPSAGSTFKRPEGYFAGKLIQDSGLRGYAVGGAQVSEKHCGFVVNRGNATCADVKKIIEDIKNRVLAQQGVKLECELLMLE